MMMKKKMNKNRQKKKKKMKKMKKMKKKIKKKKKRSVITCDHQEIGTGPFYVIPNKF